MILVYKGRWSYGRFHDDNNIFYKMKNDLTTGTWQDDICCPIIIISFCTSDVSVALSAGMTMLAGSVLGRHIRVPSLFFLKNVTSLSLNCTVYFVLLRFLSLCIHKYKANSKTQSKPDPQWLLCVASQSCRISSPLIAQGHWPQPGASSLSVGPACCTPQSSPVKLVENCLSHLPLLGYTSSYGVRAYPRILSKYLSAS